MPDETKPRRGCLGPLLIILFGVSFLFNLVLMAGLGAAVGGDTVTRLSLPKYSEQLVAGEVKPDAPTQGKIVQVRLSGVINSELDGEIGVSMMDDFLIAMRQAAEDKEVKGVLLVINSPGGEVTASDEIYRAIKRTREKKPVLALLSSIAASGGYYAACGASRIMANETSFTGSIGVIISSINYESLLGKVGVAPVVFKSGKFKDILSGSRPVTDEEQAMIQGMVMQTYDKFVGIVAEARKLDETRLRTEVADGRILTGKDALAAGLADELGGHHEAVEKIREMVGDPSLPIFEYEPGFKLGSFFKSLGKAAARPPTVSVELAPSLAAGIRPGRLYYLPAVGAGF